MLHYDSATEFTLYDIELSDDLCDSGSVFAEVQSQATDFGYFENSNGCGTTVYDDSSPINFPIRRRHSPAAHATDDRDRYGRPASAHHDRARLRRSAD